MQRLDTRVEAQCCHEVLSENRQLSLKLTLTAHPCVPVAHQTLPSCIPHRSIGTLRDMVVGRVGERTGVDSRAERVDHGSSRLLAGSWDNGGMSGFNF